jgi:hypothetical protein
MADFMQHFWTIGVRGTLCALVRNFNKNQFFISSYMLCTMGSQKVPGIVVLQYNGKTYGLGLQSRALAHTHTSSSDPAIAGSAGGRFLLESSGVRPLQSILRPHGCDMSPWGPFSEYGTAKSYWEPDPESTVVGWWQELLHNKRCVARCVIVMQKPLSLPATCRTASSELHNDQKHSVQAVQTHGAPNRRCQIIPGTFWLPLVL